jgi:antirestriction protein ArdC
MTATTTARDELLDRLTEGIARLTSSDEWLRWLDAQRRFHRYSAQNVWLIMMQRPEATRVAGFHTWISLKRCVRKGEKGIAILAPVTRRQRVERDDDDDLLIKHLVGFKVAHVFDIAQTDGDELPEAPVSRLHGDDSTDAYAQLVAVAHTIGYIVEEDHLHDGRNGDCTFSARRIRVEARNEPAQQVKTLAHEIAHALLHESFDGSRDLAELEAESTAYIVCADLGLDSSAYSLGYVATWAGGGDEAIKAITASANRIQFAAKAIVDALDSGATQLVPEMGRQAS